MAETDKSTDPVTAENTKTHVMKAETNDIPFNPVEKPDIEIDASVKAETPNQTSDTKPDHAKLADAENGKPLVTANNGTTETNSKQNAVTETKPEAVEKPVGEESRNPADAKQPVAEAGKNDNTTSATIASKAETSYTPASAVECDLGTDAREHYEFAEPLVTKGANLERLESATERLVTALQGAPEDKSTTCGYGELALLYGRALLGFVIRGATEGDVLGNTGGEDGGEEEVKDADDTKEDSTEELCWTQLEVARLAFQKSGDESRLCVAIRTIGEFLLACDQASAAGEEFGSAAGLCSGRERVECLYKRYLSLRRVSVEDARRSLEEAIEVMEGIKGTEDVVAEMKDELRALGGGSDIGKGVKRAADVTVTRVTPKRRK